MARSSLSELDHCVLSVIARLQPCTAYAVRREFQTSLTASWRASTGSIYPLLRKLVAGGHVTQTEVPESARKAKLLSLTPTGTAAVHEWLTTVSDTLAAPVADPIRTRAHLLSSLTLEEAHSLIGRWRGATAKTLRAVETRLDQARRDKDEMETRTHRGLQLQLEARLRWLDELGSS